jgi:hypothetical protein
MKSAKRGRVRVVPRKWKIKRGQDLAPGIFGAPRISFRGQREKLFAFEPNGYNWLAPRIFGAPVQRSFLFGVFSEKLCAFEPNGYNWLAQRIFPAPDTQTDPQTDRRTDIKILRRGLNLKTIRCFSYFIFRAHEIFWGHAMF